VFRKSLGLVVVLLVFVSVSFAQSQPTPTVFYTGTPLKLALDDPMSVSLILTTHGAIVTEDSENFRTLFVVLSEAGASFTVENTLFVSIAPNTSYLDLNDLSGMVYWFSLVGQTEQWVFDEPVLISLFAEEASYASVVYLEDNGDLVRRTYNLHLQSSILVHDAVEVSYSTDLKEVKSFNDTTRESFFDCDNANHVYGPCTEVKIANETLY